MRRCQIDFIAATGYRAGGYETEVIYYDFIWKNTHDVPVYAALGQIL